MVRSVLDRLSGSHPYEEPAHQTPAANMSEVKPIRLQCPLGGRGVISQEENSLQRKCICLSLTTCPLFLSHVPCSYHMSLVLITCPLFLSHVPCSYHMSLVLITCLLFLSHVSCSYHMSLVLITCLLFLSHVSCSYHMSLVLHLYLSCS